MKFGSVIMATLSGLFGHKKIPEITDIKTSYYPTPGVRGMPHTSPVRAKRRHAASRLFKPAFTIGYRGWPRILVNRPPAPTLDQVRSLEIAYGHRLHVKHGKLFHKKDGKPFDLQYEEEQYQLRHG